MDVSQNYKKDAKAILEAAPDLYLILSPQFYIVGASDSYLEATMVNREEIIGRYLFDVFPDNPNDITATGVKNLQYSLNRVLKEKNCDAMAVQKYDIRRPEFAGGDFEVRYWSLLNCPVFDSDNHIKYIIHRVKDVTEFIQQSHASQLNIIQSLQSSEGKMGTEIMQRARDIQALNKKLQENEQFNTTFLAAIPDAMILANEQGIIEYVNNQTETMFGYTKDELLGQVIELLIPEKASQVHPSHRNNYFKSPRTRPMGIGKELQAQRKNGEIFPVEISLSPIQNTNGLNAIAIIRDVTRQTEQNKLLQQKEQSLRELYETVEQERSYLETLNQKMVLITQLSETLMACRNIEEIIESFTSFAPKILDFSQGVLYLMHNSRNYLERKITWGNKEYYLASFAPHDCWALRRGCIHQYDASRPGVMCQHLKERPLFQESFLCIPLMAEYEIFGLLFIDSTKETLPLEKIHSLISVVTETVALAIANIRLKELLHSQAIRDPLTGLLNRRFLDEYAIKQIGQAKRNKTTIFFIMIDVDNFKHINDQFGHESGDYVLSLLGKLLNSLVREGDLVCRYGGEEFLLVLPNCELDNAKMAAENVRCEISKMPIILRDNDFNITVSLGLAKFPQNGRSIKKLIDAADQALYSAKKQGKNRTIIFSEFNSSKRSR
ncbi:sensor histidine kinase [Legionella santicrucis]|uniref:diguanylate cyclase n=1 Tax=Legionella santicrucis TaxID=45074 RepID=A0A0W0YCR5_9GAMM|nr:diguanylate cyclase [Legionella santicrucis]KTD54677.1 sensor histidine kinase [Legionella santicrucis]